MSGAGVFLVAAATCIHVEHSSESTSIESSVQSSMRNSAVENHNSSPIVQYKYKKIAILVIININ